MSIWKMAWRNVWRNRRRSLVTISAMSLALLSMILYSGLVRGYLDGMERSVLDYEIGDLQVFAAGYRERPSLYTAIGESETLLGALDRAGFRSSARLLGGALAAAGDSSAGASLRGVDVARDATVSEVAHQVGDGAWLDLSRPDEVVIGRRLARTLNIGKAAELVVLTQGADGSTANRIYKVRGVLRGISDATDRTAVFMTAAAFRDLMVYSGGPHQIIVRRPSGTLLEPAAASARAIAGDPRILDVQTWRQLIPTLASMMDATAGAMIVMFVIVYLSIAIVILNAMLMAVFERIREFGVLKAIGMGPGTVMGLVLLESFFQTAIAVATGLLLAVPGVYYLAKHGIDQGKLADAAVSGIARDAIWRANFTPATFVGPLVAMLVIVSIAILFPGIKAARLRPIEAMRHH